MLPPWTPDLPALDLLLSVAELGSLGRAAQAHGITQPSASARLALLERRLGVAVLVRTSRGSTLTAPGEAVVAWALDVVTAARKLTDGVLSLRQDRVVRLRIAASLTVAEYLIPEWLLRLRRRHPDLDVAVTVANSFGVADQVRNGHVDLGFIESPTVPSDMTAHAVASDHLVLVVSPDHPFAGRVLRPVDLFALPLLLREPGSGTRETFLLALSAVIPQPADARLPHASELGSTTTILATARVGGGIGVVSDRAASADLASGSLVTLAAPELELRRHLHAIWLGNQPTDLAAEFTSIAHQSAGARSGTHDRA